MKSGFVFVIALSVTYVENECGRGEKKEKRGKDRKRTREPS